MSRKPDPDGIYVAWESFGTANPDLTVRAGTKLRGDHEAVRDYPQFFMPADTPDDVIAAHRRDEYAREQLQAIQSAGQRAESDVHVPEQAEPLRDEDAVVAIRQAGVTAGGDKATDTTGEFRTVNPGDKLPRSHPMVKRDLEAFVEVTNGVPRDRAAVALQYTSSLDGEGNLVRAVHAGQWLDRDDELARINPHMFKRVGFE